MLWLDWKFSLVSLVLVTVCLIPILALGKRVKKQGKLEERRVGAMMTILQESFAGIRVIKAFAREPREAGDFRDMSEENFRNGIRVRKAIELVSPSVEAVSAVGVGFPHFYVWYTHLSVAHLVAPLGCTFFLFDPVKKLSRIHLVLQQCFVSTTSIFEILHQKPTIQDRPGSAAITSSRGDIRLDNVSFPYPPELPPPLVNLNFPLPPRR